ncbi:polysaccharide biosynthesis tyrosine autokinase [Mycolicibacterium sp.]|uniref:polysaccharide biosynthesis tyrosine autokinase n=1 Tax=Mycolicibacterium sp. TaxID=2320850 RepID=UPI0025EB01B2|nr:polysaccharide biosynthesis tyrosine autokinase [Mycolicibacterium sp.]
MLILAITVLGVALGFATTFNVVNKHLPQMFSHDYQSKATLFVATQNGTSVSEAYQNNLFSTERVVSYAGLATSEQVASRAVDQLKAPITADELRSKVKAQPIDKTVLLQVGVTDADPDQAQIYANAIAYQLVQVVSELETSRRGGTPAAGAIVVDEADYPTASLGWALWKRLVLGGVAGLVLGVLIAILVGIADRRVRGRETVEGTTNALVLGGLPTDPQRRDGGVVDLGKSSLYAERLRELRTNMRFTVLPSGKSARVIAVTSPGAEEGRTTTAIDLAAALAESGRSVVLVDGDLRSPAIAERLALSGSLRDAATRRGLSTVLVGDDHVSDVCLSDVPVGGGHTIAVLPAGPVAPRPGELWATDRAATLFEELTRNFDFVVVDTPPLSTYSDGVVVGALADGAILLARISATTSTALRRAIQALSSGNVALIGTVVTFEPTTRPVLRRHRKDSTRDQQTGDLAGVESAGDGAPTAGRREAVTETVETVGAADGASLGAADTGRGSHRNQESR